MSPTRAELLALLTDVEAYLGQRAEAEGDRPNEAMRLSTSVSQVIADLEKAEDASPTPPMICPGSDLPPAWMSSATNLGSGTCGICEREVGVGPMGTCATHPWPFSPTVVEPVSIAAALIRWLDENVSRCGHGYITVTCARCVIDCGGLR